MVCRALLIATILMATLDFLSVACAQNASPPPPRDGFISESEQPVDSAELQRRQFLQELTQSVVRLDATTDRTMNAIENSEVTLTLDTLEDGSSLSLACNTGGSALDKIVQSLVGELQESGKVQHATCMGSGRDDDPFRLKYDLHYESGRTNLFSANPPLIPINLFRPEDQLSQSGTDQETEQDPPLQPIILSSHQTQSSRTVVQLPQGWMPVKLPDPVHAESAFGTFDFTETFAEGKVTVERKLILKRAKVEPTELPAFKKWAENVDNNVSIALRSTLYYPDIDASAGTEAQQNAAALVAEAYRDIQGHELAKAEIALNKAEALDPGREVLHENRGELAAARGDYRTALAEYRKELEAFPQALIEMESIATAQRKLGDTDGETATLQRWMQADPNSPFAATKLMVKFHTMGNDDFAVRVGDEATNIMTKDAKRDVNFLTLYGQEQMLTGNIAGAKSTLESLLDLTVDGNSVNNAAYFLAEQGTSLDRAEEVTREALKQFGEGFVPEGVSGLYTESATVRANLLFATWDTLGWILYRKGELSAAESYIRAAWRNRQDIAIARHLGELLTAQEKPAEAMDVYTLGLATISAENAKQSEKDPDVVAVQAAMARFKEKGIVASVLNAKTALLELRTIDLGPSVKSRTGGECNVNMSAANFLVLPKNRREEMEPISITDKGVLAGRFPPGSNATIDVGAKLQCAKTCSLILNP